jgi:hypothetical protein
MAEPAPTEIVSLDGVTVAYGTQAALRDVTTVFVPGAVGLLGPTAPARAR